MNQHETDLLAEVREAVKASELRICITPTFTHGDGVYIEAKNASGRWKRVGPLLFPPEGGSTADTLTMLGEMRTDKAILRDVAEVSA